MTSQQTAAPVNFEEVERLMLRQRAIRLFSDRPVEDALIERAIRAATRAPSGGNSQPWRMFLKTGDFVRPSDTWVLVDEHPDSMNHGFFCVNMNPAPNLEGAQLPDCPASYHNGACGFSFADGHSEIKKWKDKRTMPPVRRADYAPGSQANNPDIEWLWSKTTQRIN